MKRASKTLAADCLSILYMCIYFRNHTPFHIFRPAAISWTTIQEMMWKIVGWKIATKMFEYKKTAHRLFTAVPLNLCFRPATHVDVLHREVMDMKLQRLRDKLSALI